VPHSRWRSHRILCIGDSIMRQNLLYFAMHISQDIMREFFDYHDTPGQKWRPEEHMGIVDVPELNFKMYAEWRMTLSNFSSSDPISSIPLQGQLVSQWNVCSSSPLSLRMVNADISAFRRTGSRKRSCVHLFFLSSLSI
jgi:hypothetical protein